MRHTVKIGPKAKHLVIPDGWAIVPSHMPCKVGDRFANCGHPNKPSWSDVEDDDIGIESSEFECLIRKESQ